jgi:hypothetical protein
VNAAANHNVTKPFCNFEEDTPNLEEHETIVPSPFRFEGYDGYDIIDDNLMEIELEHKLQMSHPIAADVAAAPVVVTCSMADCGASYTGAWQPYDWSYCGDTGCPHQTLYCSGCIHLWRVGHVDTYRCRNHPF